MSTLSIRRVHALGAADLHERVDRAARKITARFGARCTWDGDVLRIEHSSVTGTVTLGPRDITVDAELGFPLAMFRGRAESELGRILDKELGA